MSEMKPEVRFKNFIEEWSQLFFKDFTQLSQGLQISIKKRYKEPGKNREFYITNEFLNPETEIEYYIESPSKKVMAQEEDVLMTRTGNTGKVVTDVKGAFHNNFFKINYDRNIVNKIFLYHLLNSSSLQKEIIERAGTSTIPDLNHNDFYQINTFIPFLREQKLIGDYFYELEKLIESNEKELKKLKHFKKAMFQKMFPKEGETVPEIRFEEFDNKWSISDLGSNGHTFTSLSGKSKKDFGKGQGNYVPYLNVFNNPITNKNKLDKIEIDHSQTEVQYGDVFFTTSSEVPEEVGMSSVWTFNDSNIYLNSFSFGYRPTTHFDTKFLAYMLRSPLIRKQFTLLAQGISRYNISKIKSMSIKILFPTIKEQQKIGEYFYELDQLIENKQKELDKLKQLKQAMLDKMFV